MGIAGARVGFPMPDDNFPERVAYAIQKLGGTRPASRRLEISTTQLDAYASGRSEPSRVRLVRMAEAAEVDLLWFATGAGEPDAKASGFAQVPILDVRLAAGSASFAKGAVRIGHMPFDAELLRSIGRSHHDGLVVVTSEGDSMEPLIADGARVLIDTKDTRLREGIFAFRLGDELRIKRLQRKGIDGVEVLSENPRYEPELLTGPDLEHFAILGRALWCATPL